MYNHEFSELNDYELLGDSDPSLPLNIQKERHINLFKQLDDNNWYDDLDASMIEFVLDDDTFCYEDYSEKDRTVWINTRTRESYSLDSQVLADSFTVLLAYKGLKREVVVSRLRKKRKYAIFTYNPYTTLIELEVKGKRCFNVYTPPVWKTEKAKFKAELPILVEEFMTKLFPKIESREYVYDWLANGLRKKNQTYLLLLSTQGAGKGIFTSLVETVFGLDNSTIVGQTFIDKEYNGLALNKQIIVLNEIVAKDPKDLDKLKTLVDNRMVIEDKFVSAAVHENHVNVIITVNRPDAIEIEDNDRRYSVLHLTPKAMKDQVSESKLQEFIDMPVDTQLVGNFGTWLMERPVKRNMLHKYVDEEKMQEIESNTMYEYEKFILEQVCTGKTKLTNPFTSAQLNQLLVDEGYHKVGWNKLMKFINEKCSHALRCRRSRTAGSQLEIEFVHGRNKNDGINFKELGA